MCLQERIVKAMGYRVTWDEGLPDDLVDNGRESVGFLGDQDGMIWKTWNYITSRRWFQKVISCRSLIYYSPKLGRKSNLPDIFQLLPVITWDAFPTSPAVIPVTRMTFDCLGLGDPFNQPTSQPTSSTSSTRAVLM